MRNVLKEDDPSCMSNIAVHRGVQAVIDNVSHVALSEMGVGTSQRWWLCLPPGDTVSMQLVRRSLGICLFSIVLSGRCDK